MKIIVLDGYTLNPGDLSWSGLEMLGDLTVFERTPEARILDRAADAEILFTNKTPLKADTVSNLPKLKYIGVLATGFNVVDINAARERGIPVTNIPTYGTRSVAQMVFAHILNFTQRVEYHARTVREGRWSECPDFCYWDFPLMELDGRTLGIVGFGRIGRATAELGRAFGMKVLACDASPLKDLPQGMTEASLEDLFAKSDFVSLHCPLTADNTHMVNADRLRLMKKEAFIVNTSRGPLIDEAALAESLKAGTIAGAGLDVLETEPPSAGNPLSGLRNCFITPHISWATRSARSRLMETAVRNLQAFLDEKPENVVNP